VKKRIVLAVHGGAGYLGKRRSSGSQRKHYDAAVYEALQAGRKVLQRGGSAIRAVAAAVVVLEDNELFNAGKGAALCADGSVELSASIMRGKNLSVGAMVGLKKTRNPVLAAKALMGHAHCLLFGRQGDAFAKSVGLPQESSEYFWTAYRERQWRRQRLKNEVVLDHSEEDESAHGTVGAVAMDRNGNLAAATSTGGLVNQLAGRVGDTPVIGAGTWADNKTCAVSATGKGDAFARIAFARRVADLIELAGYSPERAGKAALKEVLRVKGQGGCLVLDSNGQLAMPFNSEHMVRGWWIDGEIPKAAILPKEAVPLE